MRTTGTSSFDPSHAVRMRMASELDPSTTTLGRLEPSASGVVASTNTAQSSGPTQDSKCDRRRYARWGLRPLRKCSRSQARWQHGQTPLSPVDAGQRPTCLPTRDATARLHQRCRGTPCRRAALPCSLGTALLPPRYEAENPKMFRQCWSCRTSAP